MKLPKSWRKIKAQELHKNRELERKESPSEWMTFVELTLTFYIPFDRNNRRITQKIQNSIEKYLRNFKNK